MGRGWSWATVLADAAVREKLWNGKPLMRSSNWQSTFSIMPAFIEDSALVGDACCLGTMERRCPPSGQVNWKLGDR